MVKTIKIQSLISAILLIAIPSSLPVHPPEISGAIPSASGQHQPHHNRHWWYSVWATRVTDPSRGDLVTHTRLRPDGSYVISLIYNNGTIIKYRATYNISFYGQLTCSGSVVNSLVSASNNIDDDLRKQNFEIAVLITAAPNTTTHSFICERGVISYTVRGSTHISLSFDNPVIFHFEVIRVMT